MPSGRDEWIAVAKAIYGRFGEVQITDRAAALTYYSILSLFPALLVVVSLLALLGQYPDTYQSIVETLRDAAPGAAVDTIDSALRDSLANRSNAGVLLVVGLALALYSASSAIGAAMRSLEAINRAKGPPEVSAQSGRAAGIDRAFGGAHPDRLPRRGRRRAPLREHRRRGRVLRRRRQAWSATCAGRLEARRCSPPSRSCTRSPRGAPRVRATARCARCFPARLIGTALWFAVSLLFSAYVAHFGSYDKTYGTLGALISLLIWLWLGNLAFLLGALFNAEIKRVGDEGS